MKEVKVSVIIPMFNAERFILHAIDALLAQTLKEIEVLVMDDCSPDGSAKIVQDAYGNEERVRYYKMEENGGPAKARNKGIELARGEYVTFLDSDDGIVPDALEKLYQAAVELDAEVVQSAGAYIPVMCPTPDDIMATPQDKLIKMSKDKETKEAHLLSENLAERIEGAMAGSYGGNVWGKLFRTSFLRENALYMPNLKMSEDVIMCFKCLMIAKRYVVTPYHCILYRLLGDSLSKGVKTPAFMKKVLDATFGRGIVMEEFMKDFPYFKDHPEWKKKVNDWMNRAMDEMYIRPCYQQVKEEELRADAGMKEIWTTYFGALADYVEEQFYQYHALLPEVIDFFDGKTIYTQMKAMMEQEEK